MGVAIALGAAALGTGIASSMSQAGAAADAQQTNLENAAADRALQLQLFRESRGAGGSSLLPLYAPAGTEANALEQALQAYYTQAWAGGGPTGQLQDYQNIIAAAEPSMQAGDALINKLFSGELTQEQVANMAPVFEARGKVAGAQKQGVLEGLSATLSQLKAERQRSGYSGGGSAYEKAQLTRATIPALQAAATVGAQADLANATDTANIKNTGINTQLQNLNLPISRAGNRIQLAQLPASAVGTNLQNAQSSLNWFKLGPQTITPFRTPTVSPIPSTGAIIGSGVGAGASSLGNYYLAKQLAGQQAQNTGMTIGDYQQQQNFMNEFYGTGASQPYYDLTNTGG